MGYCAHLCWFFGAFYRYCRNYRRSVVLLLLQEKQEDKPKTRWTEEADRSGKFKSPRKEATSSGSGIQNPRSIRMAN
ncbi:hypothetical protein M3Y94_01008000 [Aphelenchoides besseyi]|nr:hypothetical protein M3Y94_01008000 [Aphelenchoides besseyi]